MDYQQRLTHKIFQRLLREAESDKESRGRRRLTQSSGLAVCHETKGGTTQAIIYDPARLIEFIDVITDPNDERNAREHVLEWVIRGVIEIVKPRWACNGAWEVSASAVKYRGEGGLLYGIGYALSPGQLTCDRYRVTQDAQHGWADMKRRQGGTPFDDVNNPKTQDPSDDCYLHKTGDRCASHVDLDALNRSYEPEGWEKNVLRRMEDTHFKTMRSITPQQEKQATWALFECSDKFFREYFDPEG
jgi:hypothetical protein